MSKQKAPRRVADNEALAVGTTIRGSAQKLNLVAELIRGKKAEEALNILAFSKKAMAKDASKVLASAITSLQDARNEARRKRAYVERIVEPNMPDYPSEPRRMRAILGVFAVGMVVWAILSMLVSGIKEHKD